MQAAKHHETAMILQPVALLPTPKATARENKEICFKIEVQDRFTTQTAHFNFSSKYGLASHGYLVRCLPFCVQRLSPFHSPHGYCGV